MTNPTDAIWSFDIRHGAQSAGHAAVVLSAFSLTIIILLIGSSDMRKDRWSAFIIRPFLLAFVGNMIAAFQFIMVESDVALSERTFALLVPPVMLIIISTVMMLFGIILAVLRYYPDREVGQLSLWLFALVALYATGTIHRGMSDLYHVHEHRRTVSVALTGHVAWFVWGPGLLLLPLELLLERLRVTPERLHTINLWWCSVAVLVAVGVFGVVLLAESDDALPAGALMPTALLVAGAEWLVLGFCYYLLRHVSELRARFPLPADTEIHAHPPHVHS